METRNQTKTERYMNESVQILTYPAQTIRSLFTDDQFTLALKRNIFENQTQLLVFLYHCDDVRLITKLCYIVTRHDAMINDLFSTIPQLRRFVTLLHFFSKKLTSQFVQLCLNQLANKLLEIDKLDILLSNAIKSVAGQNNINTSALANELEAALIAAFPDQKLHIQVTINIVKIPLARRLIGMPGVTALQKGLDFYKIGGAPAYRKAMQCFAHAAINNLPDAIYLLGKCYQLGQSVPINYKMAAEHFSKAMQQGYPRAETELSKIANELDHDSLKKIGLCYVDAAKIAEAKLWFKNAIKKGNIEAMSHLAHLYENPRDAEYDIAKAIRLYKTAIEKKCPIAKNNLINLIKRIDNLPYLSKQQKKDYLRDCLLFVREHFQEDINNGPWLELAATGSRLKDCARLLLMGATNNQQKKPLASLNQAQMAKVTHLQTQLAELLRDLSLSPAKILARQVTVDHANIDHGSLERMFNRLYKLPDIAPLLELAKLAALGLHDLAGAKKPTSGYDSDHDADSSPDLSFGKKKFSMRFDASSQTTENLHYGHVDALEGQRALGIYTHGNTVFVGAKNESSSDTRATLIHEITHFIANEVYCNFANPFHAKDDPLQDKLEVIAARLEANKEQLDEILKKTFLSSYKRDEYLRELIARVPQMIVRYCSHGKTQENGITRLEKQAPELLTFYRTHFLQAVISHTALLKDRALSYWPEEAFKSKNSYRF